MRLERRSLFWRESDFIRILWVAAFSIINACYILRLNRCHSLMLTDKTLLSGTLPPELGALPSLKEIIMNDCSLHGTLPSEIGRLEQLTGLDLANNQLDHKFPSPNRIEGPIPSEIGRLSQLTWLDLRHNELTSVPTEIGDLKQLMHLCLGNNSLTSEVPADIGECSWVYCNQSSICEIHAHM